MRAFFVAALLALVVGATAPSAVAQESEDDGLRMQTSTSFRLDPEARAVHVTTDLTVTNEVPDRGDRYFFFDEIWLPALSEATNISAERKDGGDLRTRLEESEEPRWSTLVIVLRSDLRYRQTQEITLTYDLPDLPPRSDGWTRANPAHATFSAYAVGDPGLADVEVVVPAEYAVETSGAELRRETGGGVATYRATGIPEPDSWWVTFVGRNDALLEERPFSVNDHQMALRAWPGDTQWADFVQDSARNGIPALEELIGLPWPIGDELQIVESSTPDLYGYGGWYDQSADVIEISDALDPQLVLHELSHAWFNSELFAERWITEGLAEEYANRAVAATGGTAIEPEAVAPDDPGAQPLLAWTSFDPRSDYSEAQEDYGYAVSWWVIHQLTEEIGPEEMEQVIGAASGRELAYQGDPEPELWFTTADWKRTLDLLEEVGGSAQAGELFGQYVVTPTEQPLLQDRAQARERYATLASAGGTWTAPLELREAMGHWRFDDAGELFATAGQALASRDTALAVVGPLGVDELAELETAYESAEDIAVVAADAARYEDIAGSIKAAYDDGLGDVGVLESVGLLGRDVEGDLRQAALALAGGDVRTADKMTDEILGEVDRAALAGGARYALFAEGLLGVGLMWRLRERRVGSGRWQIAATSSSRSPSTAR